MTDHTDDRDSSTDDTDHGPDREQRIEYAYAQIGSITGRRPDREAVAAYLDAHDALFASPDEADETHDLFLGDLSVGDYLRLTFGLTTAAQFYAESLGREHPDTLRFYELAAQVAEERPDEFSERLDEVQELAADLGLPTDIEGMSETLQAAQRRQRNEAEQLLNDLGYQNPGAQGGSPGSTPRGNGANIPVHDPDERPDGGDTL